MSSGKGKLVWHEYHSSAGLGFPFPIRVVSSACDSGSWFLPEDQQTQIIIQENPGTFCQDGYEAPCELDSDGIRSGAASHFASVPASHRERQQDRSGARDGAEHGAQSEQDDDRA